MNSTVRVFSAGGVAVAELPVDLQGVTWRLCETGVAKMVVPRNDPKATKTVLRIGGSRVLIEFESGLPDWGGVFDFPLTLRSDACGIALTAYEGDRLLDWRVTVKDVSYSDDAGTIAAALLQAANATYTTGVVAGDIYSGGANEQRAYHYDDLLAAIRTLHTESGFDYAVVPIVVAGRLLFDLHWYQRRGTDKHTALALVEGANVGHIVIDEQGPVFNRMIVVGKGDVWATKPESIKTDWDSVYAYGMRESPRLYLNIDDQATLDSIATALLAEASQPRVRATLSGVTNRTPALFSEYDIGDILTLQCFQDWGEWSYDSAFRILSRQWNPDGTCVLEAAQWVE